MRRVVFIYLWDRLVLCLRDLAGEPRAVAELRPKLVFVPVPVRCRSGWCSLLIQIAFLPNAFAPGGEDNADKIDECPAR